MRRSKMQELFIPFRCRSFSPLFSRKNRKVPVLSLATSTWLICHSQFPPAGTIETNEMWANIVTSGWSEDVTWTDHTQQQPKSLTLKLKLNFCWCQKCVFITCSGIRHINLDTLDPLIWNVSHRREWMEVFGVVSKLAMGGFLFKNAMGDAMFSSDPWRLFCELQKAKVNSFRSDYY